jgi:hypothetical protein
MNTLFIFCSEYIGQQSIGLPAVIPSSRKSCIVVDLIQKGKTIVTGSYAGAGFYFSVYKFLFKIKLYMHLDN